MIVKFEYPLLNRTMHDEVSSKEKAVDIMMHVRCDLYKEIAKLDRQIEEMEQ